MSTTGHPADPVRSFLCSYREAVLEVRRCQQRTDLLRARCLSTTGHISGMPGSGQHGDAMAGALAALADTEELLGARCTDAMRTMCSVASFIESLDSDIHRMVLRLRYLDLLSWPQVQREMDTVGCCYTERQMFRIHGAALQAAREKWPEFTGERETEA